MTHNMGCNFIIMSLTILPYLVKLNTCTKSKYFINLNNCTRKKFFLAIIVFISS